jgi:hypothetical protein
MVVEPVEGRFREGETPVDSGVGGGGSFMAQWRRRRDAGRPGAAGWPAAGAGKKGEGGGRRGEERGGRRPEVEEA